MSAFGIACSAAVLAVFLGFIFRVILMARDSMAKKKLNQTVDYWILVLLILLFTLRVVSGAAAVGAALFGLFF